MRRVRRLLLWVGLAAAALVFGACQENKAISEKPGARVTARPVIASDAYAARVGPDAQRAKLSALEPAVERLRQETGSSGWQVRQDDVTGDASELSGGVYQAGAGTSPLDAVRRFLQSYGHAFGLQDASSQLAFAGDLPVDAQGSATFRSNQLHQKIPVDGASILVAIDKVPTNAEISLVRGRIFGGINVPIAPAVRETDARDVVSKLTGAPVTSKFSLTVYTKTPQPVLAWVTEASGSRAEQTATATGRFPGVISGPSRVFVDASSGALLEVRPSSTDFLGPAVQMSLFVGAPLWQPRGGSGLGNFDYDLPPPGQEVDIAGTAVGGLPVTVAAEQQPDGSIAFIDSTGPGADRQSKSNLLTVHDGRGIAISPERPEPDLGDLPGPILALPPGAEDVDAITAAWAARQVIDYFTQEHGRSGFDGAGAPLPSTVHIPQPGPGACPTNGAFITVPGKSQMIYGEPCVDDAGTQVVATWVDIGVVGHEVMHGVTHSGALNLGDSVQSGAVDEGTSDYFGVILQNRAFGTANTTVGVLLCEGVGESPACLPQPDGNRGVRNVDTGATFDDYEFVIEEPLGIAGKTVDALHENALIFTNALWKIRTRFAALDGGDVNASPTARLFDRVVYRAVTRLYTDTTDFLAAAEAVQRAAGEIPEVTAQERDIIRRQFVDSKLCRGCNSPPLTARPVAISSNVKTRPQVAAPGVVYTEYSGRLSSVGLLNNLESAQGSPVTQQGKLTLFASAAGDYGVDLIVDVSAGNGAVHLRNLRTGAEEELSTSPGLAQPAVSADSVAWFDERGGPSGSIVWRPAAGGAERSLAVPELVQHVAVDGPLVAFQLVDGTLGVWDPERDQETVISTLPTPRRPFPGLVAPGGLAISGERVAVIAFAGSVNDWALLVFDRSGFGSLISDRASPFGVAIRGDLVIWADNTGLQSGRVSSATGSEVVDTDIEAYSFATDTFYRVFPLRGQQGFPSFDGTRLAWQDSALGGNDIFTVQLPEGL